MPRLLDAINKAEVELRKKECELEPDRFLPATTARLRAPLAPTRINSLRSTVLRHHRERGLKSIMLTGAYAEDGTTTTAVSLATTLSMDCGAKVLLADADIKHPSLHDVFKTNPADGLPAVISEKSKSVSCKKVGPGDLYFIPGGKPGQTGDGYFDSPVFESFLRTSRKTFDFVILDTAPVLSNPDALAICSKVDGVIIVIAYGKVRRLAAQRLKAILENAGANLLGVVVNRRRHFIPDWIYNKL
jgi:protein-tyrosine kinase